MNNMRTLKALILAALLQMLQTSAMAADPDADADLRARTRNALAQPPLHVPVPDTRATEDQLERTRRALQQAPRKGMPDISVARRKRMELKDLLRSAPKIEQEDQVGPIVFVSLAVPMPSLVQLASDAKRVGGVLVMRGTINGSLKQTVAALQRLSEQGVEIQIDPQAFTRYGVAVVPSVLVDLGGSGGCEAKQSCTDRSALIEGDVTLGHALDHIARTTGSKRLRSQVQQWTAMLSGVTR